MGAAGDHLSPESAKGPAAPEPAVSTRFDARGSRTVSLARLERMAAGRDGPAVGERRRGYRFKRVRHARADACNRTGTSPVTRAPLAGKPRNSIECGVALPKIRISRSRGDLVRCNPCAA